MPSSSSSASPSSGGGGGGGGGGGVFLRGAGSVLVEASSPVPSLYGSEELLYAGVS